MRVPIRKPGKYTHDKPDPHMTEEKYNEFKQQLENIKKYSFFPAIEEVKRLSEMGDFSENAAYQMAKGRLRGINQKILDLENHLKRAVIIKPARASAQLQLGQSVTIEIEGRERTYVILGSTETDPAQGIISHLSPIGAALINRRVGETVEIRLKDKEVECRIIAIS